MQLKKSFLHLSKLITSSANKKSFQISPSLVIVVQLKKSFLHLSKLITSSANKKSFQISPSLVIVVQSWKSRFKICQSQELESRF